ncbi:hypothetical protein OLX02_07465 [Novosphingobium sp. KCTC 2891]|uniref:hypothetical protein n=1 Tax=Novosphingobium sp. KCTC 2891 TaxID=2989730 RepID=UPI002223046D|nr:hypothetical protein [Novosphingobium sp. KCTC 2891]MCW1382659.1 hypothetical protein [Novosphingobium sp. KCTC 2891]
MPARAEPLPAPAASFTAPDGCIPDQALATASQAAQACVERFSPTHEFIITLKEIRVRSTDPKARADADVARMVVEEAVARLRKANEEGQPGQILLSFGTWPMPPDALLFPKGADSCANFTSVAIDRRVPGFGSDEFRIWATGLICGRVDKADNSIRVVELKASERFRVKSDQFKERFKNLVPFERYDLALKTLTLGAAP